MCRLFILLHTYVSQYDNKVQLRSLGLRGFDCDYCLCNPSLANFFFFANAILNPGSAHLPDLGDEFGEKKKAQTWLEEVLSLQAADIFMLH